MTATVADTTGIEEFSGMEATGYGPATYFAAKYSQGKREVYSIDLSLNDLVDNIRRPDPDERLLGNRLINVKHARSYARYLLENQSWTAPPLLLRIPNGELKFESKTTIGGAEWGILSIPRAARDDLSIVDGQHRVLGTHIARDMLAQELRNARDHLSRAKSNDSGERIVKDAELRLQRWKDVRQRFERERMTLQVVVEDDLVSYRQMFSDIASNALGISQSVQTRFDSRKIVNRCIEPLIDEHPMLGSLVDIDKDRITAKSRYLMSAKHVGEIIRILQVGPNGRIGKRMEDELKEANLIKEAKNFLETLLSAYPDLRDLTDPISEVDPLDLRSKSLLGSVTVHKLLAGVYWTLTTGADGEPPMNSTQVRDFFHSLDMTAPVPESSPWRGNADWFDEPYMAPTPRRQLTQSLEKEVCRWAREGMPALADDMGNDEPERSHLERQAAGA